MYNMAGWSSMGARKIGIYCILHVDQLLVRKFTWCKKPLCSHAITLYDSHFLAKNLNLKV